MRKSRRDADVSEEAAIGRIQRVYDTNVERIVKVLAHQLRSDLKASADPHWIARAMTWVDRGFRVLSKNVSLEMAADTSTVYGQGIAAAADVFSFIRGADSVLNDAAKMSEMVTMKEDMLALLRERSTMATAGNIKMRVHQALRDVTPEMHVSDLISTTAETMHHEGWQLRRLVRTETSYAYNLAQTEGLQELASQDEFRGKVFSRWTERIDDFTGRPFDDKVAKDSFAMHGQVVVPGQYFRMPEGAPVSARLTGRSWPHPPNRPNDRAVLTPWMQEWGVPAWMWKSGVRITM